MLKMGWTDLDGLKAIDRAMSKLQAGTIRKIGARSLNRAGTSGRTHTGRALVRQTGLKRKIIRAAMIPKRATYSDLEYRITARGGDVALKYFDARETRKGVSARPFGKRTVFRGTFIKGGRFPSRKNLSMGGHVYARTGRGRLPIEKQRSGVVIPNEMIKGESAKAWEHTTGVVFQRRVMHEIKRETGKVFG
ncbi:hypothetical protein [uncultured Roseibium sp.]|uniref:hypothetical protein n=1 Tax=uncultured Roseibium sp. TaxID=1936171 RepID=UPI00260F014A|nr:hypothetical protein [uncultured Roseibium sp.]